MNIHIATLNGLHYPPEHYAAARKDEETINRMAMQLVAATYCGIGLADIPHCIEYLLNTEDRWRAPEVRKHFDAALYEAQQAILMAAMGMRS